VGRNIPCRERPGILTIAVVRSPLYLHLTSKWLFIFSNKTSLYMQHKLFTIYVKFKKLSTVVTSMLVIFVHIARFYLIL
jgi:hypothetical protein